MRTIILVLLILCGLMAAFVIWFRPWIRDKPWAKPFFDWVEPIEIVLWKKSETILWARFLMFIGALPPFLEQLEKLNVPVISELLPDELKGWWTLTFTAIGIITEFLRRDTSQPLAVVAAPEAVKDATPEVQQMKQANVEAVVAVDAAVAATSPPPPPPPSTPPGPGSA